MKIILALLGIGLIVYILQIVFTAIVNFFHASFTAFNAFIHTLPGFLIFYFSLIILASIIVIKIYAKIRYRCGALDYLKWKIKKMKEKDAYEAEEELEADLETDVMLKEAKILEAKSDMHSSEESGTSKTELESENSGLEPIIIGKSKEEPEECPPGYMIVGRTDYGEPIYGEINPKQNAVDKEMEMVERITSEDMVQFKMIPYNLTGPVKKFFKDGGHPFAYIDLDEKNQEIARNHISQLNELIINACNYIPLLEKGYSIQVEKVVFHEYSEFYGYTRIMCNPYTKSGKISKLPISLIFMSRQDEQRYSFNGEISYGRDGAIQKAKAFVSRRTRGYECPGTLWEFYFQRKSEILVLNCAKTTLAPDKYGRATAVYNADDNHDSKTGEEKQKPERIYVSALEQVLAAGQVSVSMLQRRLKLTYSKAAEIIDCFELCGIVGPFEGATPRKIYVKDLEQAKEMLAGYKKLTAAEQVERDIKRAMMCDEIIQDEINWRREQLGLSTVEYELYRIDVMEGHEFEHWCADLLKKSGFTDVEVTKGSGDQGVDVIAVKDGIRYAIQCKCYSSDLGNKPVQEVHAGKVMYKCQVGVVMTNRHFTAGAKELADATGVLLWDRDKLEEMLGM